MRTVDIAHSGQTVPEALAQLTGEIKQAQRLGDDSLLVVHGFGASGVGGAIKDALISELPRLARVYGFKAIALDSKVKVPRGLKFDARRLSQGSSLLVFRKAPLNKESGRDFRPNFRNLKKVTVRASTAVSGQETGSCRHADRQLLSRGPSGNTYKCRRCGGTFLVMA